MRIFVSKPSAKLLVGLALLALLAAGACQQQQTSTNTTTATNNGAASTGSSNASNANMSSAPAGATIETREPDQYSATITMKAEVTGSTQNMSTPALSADFARNGADRRISFKIPGGDQVIYLDRADKRFIILPTRKQYAEIDAQSTGFNVPQVMSPAQIINQVKNVSGCEKAGEEPYGGRSAVKYRCASAAKTGTQAGEVKTESFIYVDKDTSLPLRSESVISSSGNVGGASAVKIVTEMTNIQTSVPADTFAEPAGMSKVDPNQVRAQVEAILKAAAYFAQGMLGGGAAAPPPPPPASSSSPAAANLPAH